MHLEEKDKKAKRYFGQEIFMLSNKVYYVLKYFSISAAQGSSSTPTKNLFWTHGLFQDQI